MKSILYTSMANVKKEKNEKVKKEMTMAEAGKKGGEATFKKFGTKHMARLGKKGGQRVKELIAKGKESNSNV